MHFLGLKSALFKSNIAILAFLFISVSVRITFTFNHYVSLHLKQVSCRKHIVGFCFLIHSDDLCFLIGVFRPLVFQVFIGIAELISAITCFLIIALFFFSYFCLNTFPFFCGFH